MSPQEASKSELNKHLDELLFRPSLNIQSGFFFLFCPHHSLSLSYLPSSNVKRLPREAGSLGTDSLFVYDKWLQCHLRIRFCSEKNTGGPFFLIRSSLASSG